MCDRLGQLRQAMSSYATAFDAALLSCDQAVEAVREAAAIETMAAHLKGLAAARMAETRAWSACGARSAAHHLADTTGTSVSQAADTIATARRMQALPAIDAAARAGGLSASQVAAVADAAVADPTAEARLVQEASTASLAELRQECLRTKASAAPDAEARRRAIHAGRYLRSYTDAAGAWNLHMRDNPERGARVMAAIDLIRDELFRAARAEGRRESTEAYAADALAELAGVAEHRGGAGTQPPSNPDAGRRASGAKAKVIVRVDLAALLRGRAVDDEVCEVAGYGPVAVSAVRDLIDTEDPMLAAVVTRGRQVVGVAHLGRRPNAVQQTALEWLYPTCAVQGCSATTWLENDHRADWAKTHMTVIDLLDRLCTHHHDLKSTDGWALVAGHGKRAFVAPADPRHPRHAHGPPATA